MSTIQCSVNPTIGNDDTGRPYENNKPILSYKTLEGCIGQNSDNDGRKLTCLCTGGRVTLGDSDRYANITLFGIDSDLTINTMDDTSIEFVNISINMDTTVVTRNTGITIPAIITSGLFSVIDGNALNLVSTSTDPNIVARPVFQHNGQVAINNTSGRIDSPNSDIIVHLGGTGTIGFFDVMNVTPKFKLYVEKPGDQIIIDGRKFRDVTLNIHENTTVLKTLVEPAIAVLLIVIAATTPFSVFVPFRLFINSLTLGPPPEQRPRFSLVSAPGKVSAFENDNKVFISGGTIINGTPEMLDVFASDIPSNLNKVNLIDAEAFSNNTLALGSDYNISNETNSYNNSGSIFRKVRVLNDNYTHTLDDGYNFLIDASIKNIIIDVPTDVLESRTFQYKRIDFTNHIVRIFSPKGIDDKGHYSVKNSRNNLGKIKLVGHNGKLWTI